MGKANQYRRYRQNSSRWLATFLLLKFHLQKSTAFLPQTKILVSRNPPIHHSCLQLQESEFEHDKASNEFTAVRYDISTRRDWLQRFVVFGTSSLMSNVAISAHADDGSPISSGSSMASPPALVEMKEFIDPQGLFSLRVPKDFFTLRMTQKGDLPDAKTGKGRRGSSIFTAGNMAKAEVVAVERFPTRLLLEENGVLPTGDLSSFPAIGDATAIANLIVLRRGTENQRMGTKVIDSVQVTPDGKELTFRLKTEIEVQKPELLMEQNGVSQLFRVTIAKATLNSNDGNIMAVFASALEQDFNNGVDGPALEESVRSFQATNPQSS